MWCVKMHGATMKIMLYVVKVEVSITRSLDDFYASSNIRAIISPRMK